MTPLFNKRGFPGTGRRPARALEDLIGDSGERIFRDE